MKTKYLNIDDITFDHLVCLSRGRIKRYWDRLFYNKVQRSHTSSEKWAWTLLWVYVWYTYKWKISFQQNYIRLDHLMEILKNNVFPKRFNTVWKKDKLCKWFDECISNLDVVDRWKPWNFTNNTWRKPKKKVDI